uniref:Uncharacterized protein n=1 Tax=Arundo donax TaxID=35708 RepID=A0A0A8ZZ66_ARUDO
MPSSLAEAFWPSCAPTFQPSICSPPCLYLLPVNLMQVGNLSIIPLCSTINQEL